MESFLAPDGRRLAYRDSFAEGGVDGPVVLCLAGLTRNMRDFDSVAATLGSRFRVIRLDCRGRGASEHAVDPMAEYQIPIELGDVLALVAHLGLTRLVVIGTSRGGILGLLLAGARPDLVAGLVLNDVGARLETAGLLAIMQWLGKAPAASDFDTAAQDLAEAYRSTFPDVPLSRWRLFAEAIYDNRDGRPVLSYDPALRAVTEAGFDASEPFIDLWPLVDPVTDLPMLLIRGANSDLLAAETVTEMQERCANLEAIEIAKRGHVPFLDEPDAIAAIEQFLEGVT
ncbi:MAG: alpha/beta hydrolase [Pseudomonadota bacterium]